MSKDNGGKAFPGEFDGKNYNRGMTLKDYFMVHAPDVPQDYSTPHKHRLSALGIIVKWRSDYADAMIAERGKD